MTKTIDTTTIDTTTGTKVATTLRLRGTFHRFGLGFVAEGDEGRQEMHGPLVPGPWAYAFGLCTVIDNYGGTGREAAEREEAGLEHEVSAGDVVVVGGHRYTVRIERGQYLYLDARQDGETISPKPVNTRIEPTTKRAPGIPVGAQEIRRRSNV